MKPLSTFLRQLTLALMIAGTVSTAFAEEGRGPGKHEKPDFTALFEELQLSDDQRTELSAVMEKHHNERRQGSSDLREQHKSELAGVLTEEQLEIFQSYMESHRPPRPKHR